jgi:ligand-binding sensor domain-containing protein
MFIKNSGGKMFRWFIINLLLMLYCNSIIAQTSNKISTFTPSTLTISENQSADVTLRIFINNVTPIPGAAPGLTASLVMGNPGDDLRFANKRSASFKAEYQRDIDEYDEFKATVSGLSAGTYSFICTFTYNGLEFPVGYVTTPDDGFFHMGNITVNAIENVDLSHWANYIGGGRIITIAEDENYIWAGGTGLARINKTTDEVTLFTRVNSGLPDNNVVSIVVDQNGNKWIATGSGLAKLDGTNWTVFNSKYSGIASDFIYDLSLDSKGNLWAGTSNGISKFDGANWINYESALWKTTYPAAYELAIDNNDIVWAMVSYNGVLVKFDGITWTLYERGKSFIPQNASTRTIAVDKNNKLWLSYYASSKYGVIVYDGSNSIDYNTGNTSSLPYSYITNIYIDKNDNKWFAGKGLVKFDNVNWTVVNDGASGLSDANTNSVITNSSGNIYVGTNYGVDKFDGANWKNYRFSNKPELNSYGVQGFTEATNGDVWINSWEGLTKVSNGAWTSYNSKNTPVLSSQINKIVFDKSGILWLSLANGLVKYDGSNWQLFDKSNSGLPDTYIWDIAVDPSANVWLATDAGIIKYDGTNWTTFKKEDRGYTGSASEQVLNIVSDSKGYLFAAWSGGFTILKNNEWTNYDSKNSILKSNYISSYSLDVDNDDNIWCSTNNYGAYEFTNDGVWKEFNSTNSGLPGNSIRKIFIDAQNNLWFCTYGWGIAKYDGTNWTYITTANSGLGTNSTRGILIDKDDNYWIGTFAGLSYYNPNVVDVEQDYQNIPSNFELFQNYPNPFNPVTTIKYQIPASGNVTLKVFDVLGREVVTLVNEFQTAGNYIKTLNATSLSSGVYFYHLQADNYSATKKLLVLK